jgi:exodeoxyribonuclease VII small subunit
MGRAVTGVDEPLSYEQARTELAAVVERLEAGGCTLEESLALWERGEHLAEVCQQWLDRARERLASREQPDQPGEPPDRGAPARR